MGESSALSEKSALKVQSLFMIFTGNLIKENIGI